ncbi:MAG: Response regulator consisting of a CheY-like receiver domain and a winged-helix DNA-binding domain [Acidobacteria bacterium]|jgi:DNA-binding response OmpR family regulator|nr:Response regulator consisting of a CheY-like receiver domain and a winged-helix DNA-binding domain [Acidobacteriota bacterium]
MPKKILVAEDDRDLSDLLRYNLEREGYQVIPVRDGNLVMPNVRKFAPDLLILDLMLPGMDGLDICRQLRQTDQSLPVLMLTARAEETDRVVGLEIGADDYVTKPFSLRELIARVRALLRRQESAQVSQSILRKGALFIDPLAHVVKMGDRPVELSALEFRLLHFLASNAGIVFSRQQILDRIWGADRNVTLRSIDVYVRRLREKLEDQPESSGILDTVRGVGYRFALSDAEQQ